MGLIFYGGYWLGGEERPDCLGLQAEKEKSRKRQAFLEKRERVRIPTSKSGGFSKSTRREKDFDYDCLDGGEKGLGHEVMGVSVLRGRKWCTPSTYGKGYEEYNSMGECAIEAINPPPKGGRKKKKCGVKNECLPPRIISRKFFIWDTKGNEALRMCSKGRILEIPQSSGTQS